MAACARLIFVVALALALQSATPAQVFDQAKKALDQSKPGEALELLAPLAPERPSKETPKAAAPVYLLRGVAELSLGHEERAAAGFERALALAPDLAPARFNLGRLRLKQNRLEDAAAQFEALVASSPGDASIHHLLGVTYHEMGRLHDARAELEKSLALLPGNVQSSTRLGAVLFDLGLYELSAKSYEQAIAGGADTPFLHNALARAYLKRGEFNDAARELEAVVKATRPTASVMVDWGYCLLNTGRFEEARDRFAQAAALEPGNLFARFQLGIALSKLGDRAGAISALEASVDEPTVRADAHNELARLYTAAGEIDVAVDHCRAAIAIAPYLVDAYYQLGRLLARQGKTEEAQKMLARFQELSKIEEDVERLEHQVQVSPENVASLFELAKVYRRQGRDREALETVTKAVQIEPDEPALQKAMAELLLQANRGDEALVAADRAIALRPDDASALHLKASALVSRGDLKEAESYLRRSVELDPSSALALSDLGVLLSKTGRGDEARAAFEKAIAADGTSALPRNGLGVLYSEKGDLEKAVSLFEDAVRLDPGYAAAYLNLAEALHGLGRDDEAAEQQRNYERLTKESR
jgi:tetratricopeptide (TPR) repeat protein